LDPCQIFNQEGSKKPGSKAGQTHSSHQNIIKPLKKEGDIYPAFFIGVSTSPEKPKGKLF
jgi:hypothetical protein